LGVVGDARELVLREVGHGFPRRKGSGRTSHHTHGVTPSANFVTECQIAGNLTFMTAELTLRDHARGAVREEVMRQAWLLFSAQGFEATTVDQIAAAAGMSRRTFFRYFAGKDELVLTRLVESGQSVVDALRLRPADEPVWVSL